MGIEYDVVLEVPGRVIDVVDGIFKVVSLISHNRPGADVGAHPTTSSRAMIKFHGLKIRQLSIEGNTDFEVGQFHEKILGGRTWRPPNGLTVSQGLDQGLVVHQLGFCDIAITLGPIDHSIEMACIDTMLL